MAIIFAIVAVMFTSVSLILNYIISPHKPNEEKLSAYECGEESEGTAWIRFNVRFYIVALIFILFDVELVFLFPWATLFGNSYLNKVTDGYWAWYTFAEMVLFVFILALGLAYAWVKGHLDWVKPETKPTEYKSPVPEELYNKYKLFNN